MNRGYGAIWWLPALVAAFSILHASTACAQGDRPVVFAATNEHKQEIKSLLDAVSGQLVDQPVYLEVQWVRSLSDSLPKQLEIADELGREHRAVAVFWLMLDDDETIHLYLTVPRSGRVTYRRLSREDGVLGEVLGVIVRASISSILAGGDGDVQLGESRMVEIKASSAEGDGNEKEKKSDSRGGQDPVPGAAQSNEDTGPRLGIEAGYRFEAYSKQHPAVSAVSIGLSVRFGSHWALTARTAFVVTELDAEKERVALELERHPSGLDLWFFGTLGRFDLGVVAGVGVDVVEERVSTTEDLEPYGSRREIIFSGNLELRGEVRLWSDLFVWAAAGGCVPFNPVDYVAETRDQRVTVAQAFAVRPVALVGLIYRPF